MDKRSDFSRVVGLQSYADFADEKYVTINRGVWSSQTLGKRVLHDFTGALIGNGK